MKPSLSSSFLLLILFPGQLRAQISPIGTLFLFNILFESANSLEIAAVSSTQPAAKRQEGSCVLLAEDNKMNQVRDSPNPPPLADRFQLPQPPLLTFSFQVLLKRMLHEIGVAVDIADDGEIAVRMAAQKRYSLLLFDYLMPHMTGLEAAAAIGKACPFNQRTPVLVLSASSDIETRRMVNEAGLGFIPKPTTLAVLRSSVERSLETGSASSTTFVDASSDHEDERSSLSPFG